MTVQAASPQQRSACPQLARLVALTSTGQFRAAVDLVRDCDELKSVLGAENGQVLEALLRACEVCDQEARVHHDALGRAIEREQVLGARLRECTDHLVNSLLRAT